MTLAPERPVAPSLVLTARRLTGPDAVAGLDRLEGLWARTATPITARGDWLRAALLTGPAWLPVLLLVERDGEPVAAAALATRRERGVRTVRSMDLGQADHVRLPADDDAAARRLARELVALLRDGGPWRLDLPQLPPGDPVVEELARALPLRLEEGSSCPLALLDGGKPLEEHLSKNGRKSLRAARNRLASDGHAFETVWSRGDELLAALPQIQDLRRERDNATGRASELDSPGGLAFHRTLVETFARQGRAELLTLHVDGELAAFDMVVRDGDRLRVFDGRVTPGHERYSIGWLSHVEVLTHAHADPDITGVDWLRGEQQNKTRSEAVVVASTAVRAESAPWVRALDAQAERATTAVLDVLRKAVPPHRRHQVRGLLRRG